MKDNPEIKNLILDFGGVIYQISHQKQKKAFMELGLHNFDDLYSQAIQNPLFEKFETGKISSNEFRKALAKLLPGNITIAETDHAWNSILAGYYIESVSLLKRLGPKYKLFLLSNTNAIHYNIYTAEFADAFGYDFETLFARAYWSFKIGLRKPGHEIYKRVLEENRLNVAECIFIDDTLGNVEAAAKCGIKTIWIKPGLAFTDLFDDSLNLTL